VAYLSPTTHPASQPAAAPGPSPEQVGAEIATGVLCLWTPFTLIIAVVLAMQPHCTDTAKPAICTPLGHLATLWSGTFGASLGLLVVLIGCWLAPRRHPGLYALAGLTLATAGLVATLTLAAGAPIE
jgi:hypothetical protein